MRRNTLKPHTLYGFLITFSAGPDAPWRGWREDGISFRADTLNGAFKMARYAHRDNGGKLYRSSTAGRMA